MEEFEKKYSLSPAAVDDIAEEVMGFCLKVNAERSVAIRHRILVEESLLNWMSAGDMGSEVILRMGIRLFTPFIEIEEEGSAKNPYQEEVIVFGSYYESILATLDLSPSYSYERGRNKLTVRIKKESIGQLKVLGLVILGSALFGMLGRAILPDAIRNMLLTELINPVYDTFFNILGCVAGPMIFLSVAWGVYGIGDVFTLSRVGKKMMLSFLRNGLLCASGGLLLFPLLGPGIGGIVGARSKTGNILTLILGMFPSNIVTPFEEGNTLQIIVLAMVIGIGLLYLGKKTRGIVTAIEQVNILVQFLMDIISRLVPFVIFLVIVTLIWSQDMRDILSVWKLILALLIAFFTAGFTFILITSIKQKVPFSLLLKKSIPAFLIALSSASSAAAFGENVSACENKFGIDSSITGFGIPLGMVVHKPIASLYDLLLTFYFAGIYKVECSMEWLIMAVFICTVVAVATPPIPGGGAIAYTIIFAQMGIPDAAMALALTIDIVTDFLVTAFETLTLQMAMINVSSEVAMIDRSKLISQENV